MQDSQNVYVCLFTSKKTVNIVVKKSDTNEEILDLILNEFKLSTIQLSYGHFYKKNILLSLISLQVIFKRNP